MQKFSVPEMTCGHCTAAIKDGILKADEGADLRFDLADHSVEIESVLDQPALLAALKSAGYEAKPVN